MKPLQTLRVRFALWTAGLLALALILFGAIVYASMSQSLVSNVDETLQLTTTQLTNELHLDKDMLVSVENPVEDTQYTRLFEQGFSMRVWNRESRIVQSYGPYQSAMSQPRTGEMFLTADDPQTHESIRIYNSPVAQGERVVGTLQVALNLRNAGHTLAALLTTLLVCGPFVVLAAGCGGYFLAARALAPIDAITRTAQQISANDLSARLGLAHADDELGRLAATFDSMLARLDDAFRRQRQFTDDASHELRTPLAALHTIISSTLARRREPAEYERALGDVRLEVARMQALTEQLLQLARLDHAHPAHFEAIDLAVLLGNVAESLEPLAADKGLRLCTELPDNLELCGDEDALIRLFVNLLDNAIKYTRQGEIRLAAAEELPGLIVVTVADSGVGIAAEHLPYVFDRFYRIDEARAGDGIGLGLAIARDIARTHGGDISVTSISGSGTTFTVRLAREKPQ